MIKSSYYNSKSQVPKTSIFFIGMAGLQMIQQGRSFITATKITAKSDEHEYFNNFGCVITGYETFKSESSSPHGF
jgi:hypothetical protein